MTQAVELTLYSRTYCHLCHDMLTQLIALRSELGGESVFSVKVVDVDQDPVLEARYDELVPVLSVGERTLCHYFLQPDAVRAYLAEIR